MQLYREHAYNLDRTAHYIDRVGLDYIKQEVVENAERRKELYERLLYSLKDLPDPWAARIAGAQKHEFQPLAVAAVAAN